MELSERQLTILQAIIHNYLETGEPVGSRTISKYTDLSLSSATIRNEMADLEEMGYIIQPHTSAGRIPTDKAYRLYVDTMMDTREQEIKSMRDSLMEKAGKLEQLLQEMANLLAANTNYASLVSGPTYPTRKVKFLQLTEVDSHHILLVMVLEGNLVRNKVLTVQDPVGKEMLLKLNLLLNTSLQGLSMNEINMTIISQLKAEAGSFGALVGEILDTLAQVMGEGDDVELYTSGATNIFKYPELSDKEKAAKLLDTFEEKETLSKLISWKPEEEDNGRSIQVYIGNETAVSAMQDCSLVTATYQLGEGVYGRIGILGPKRMDYEKVVGTLQKLMTELDDIFK